MDDRAMQHVAKAYSLIVLHWIGALAAALAFVKAPIGSDSFYANLVAVVVMISSLGVYGFVQPVRPFVTTTVRFWFFGMIAAVMLLLLGATFGPLFSAPVPLVPVPIGG